MTMINEVTIAAPKRRTRTSLAQLAALVADYPPEVADSTRWMQELYFHRCHADAEEITSLGVRYGVHRSRSFYYNMLHGHGFKHGARGELAIENWNSLVEAFKSGAAREQTAPKMNFIQTPTSRAIAAYIDERRASDAVCKFGGIAGPTGSGKTASLIHYAAEDARVVRVEAPSNRRLSSLQGKIATMLCSSKSVCVSAIRRETAIREGLTPASCVIIDNCQRLFEERKGGDQDSFNWLLEMQEDAGCTVILSFTEQFTADLAAGSAREYFEQFVGRMGGLGDVLALPQYASAGDLRTFAKAFGLGSVAGAAEILRRWSRERGRFRILFHRLQRARQLARLDDRTELSLSDLEEADRYTPPKELDADQEDDA